MGKDLWLAVVILLVGVGCGREFGIDGRIDKAVARDSKENLKELEACPAGTHREKPQKPCADPDPSCKGRCVADSDAGSDSD